MIAHEQPPAEAAAQANYRQWQALCEPQDYHAPFQGPEGAGPAGAYTAAMLAAEDYAAYLALRVERQEATKLVVCDCCRERVPLEECFIDADDCVLCRDCAEAPLLAEED